MPNHQLIGVDQMEATKLRRKLDPIDPWDNAKSERVKPVIAEIAESCDVEITPTEPRWEYGVYPCFITSIRITARTISTWLCRGSELTM